MLKRSYVIALSAISCAMAVIAVVVQGYLPTLRIAVNVIAALFIALPLTKNSFVGALFAFICASIIGFFTVNIQALPFIMLFGSYALVQWVLDFKFYKIDKLPKWLKIAIITIVKIGYFFLMFWACLELMQVVVTDIAIFGWEWTYAMLYAIGFVLFCIYDPLYRWVFRCMGVLVDRHVGKNSSSRKRPAPPKAGEGDKSATIDVFAEQDDESSDGDGNAHP